jgi:glycosyltransferase involved in cell wall biosynthesis
MRLPSVSVVIPTKGRPQLLRRALASVQAQDYDGAIECIVVFDGEEPSDPGLPFRPDRPIRLITNDRAPGPAGAYNAGIARADADLIAFLDDDDEWEPGKTAAQAQVLAARSDAILATCGIRVVRDGRGFLRVPATDTVRHADLVGSRRTELHSSTLMIGRPDLDRVGLYDESFPAGYGEDYDWLLRAASIGDIAVVRRVLATVYIGHSFFSRNWDVIAAGVQRQIVKHPELTQRRQNLSRMYGKIAFARAASGRSQEGFRWALRSWRLDPRQWRAYAAVAVGLRIASADRVMRALEARGRGL